MPLQDIPRRLTVFRRIVWRLALFVLVCSFLDPHVFATNVLTQHNDNSRDGANLTETNLTPANVNVSQFGKLFTRTVDGAVYAQPLYMNNITISGKTQNVVFVVTEHDSVYAFDADTPANTTPLWQVSLGTSVPTTPFFSCSDLRPEVGITSTPVIDPTTGTIYVVAKMQVTVSSTSTNYFHQLHALDITTGAEKFGGPVTIQPTVNGISFNALHQNQRAALLLLSNVVYVAESSHCDSKPYNGWLLGFNATNLSPVVVFNTTPGSLNNEGAIWGCGMGPAADTNGNIFVTTGNGAFNATNPPASGTNYGQCFIKFSTTNGFAVADWFSPYDEATLSSGDKDIGTGGAVLLPGTHLLMGLGKNGTNYLLDQNNLGHQSQNGISDTNIVQEFLATTGADRMSQSPVIWIGPANEYIYISAMNNNTLTYIFNGSTIQTTPIATTAAKQGNPPGGMSLSANGTSNGIVWVVYTSANVLYAYNATNMPAVLWSSTNNTARDGFANSVKFVSPTIADGKVFVSTTNSVVAYGVFTSPPSGGTNLIWTGASGANSNWSTALNWTNAISGSNGPPQPTNSVTFDNTAAVSSPSTPNNAVDGNTLITSLLYDNNAANTSPNYNVTHINDGVTLTVTNGLSVSTGADSGSNQVVNAAINGLNGTLVVSNGVFAVGQGSGADGPHRAVLDLSGLGNLEITNVSRLAVGVGAQPPQSGNGAQRACGLVYLAKTNLVQVTSTGVTNGILVGWNDSQGNGNSSGIQNALDDTSSLFLGQTNAIFSDAIYVGTDKTLGALLAFNPNGLTSPAGYFRNKDGVSRVSLWGIGDSSMKNNSNQSASGTNDFTGGSIDAMINAMTIGITQTGASGSTNTGNGTGTLTFNAGTIDVNNLTNGASIGTGTEAGTDIGTGVINVNGTATLKVNNNLALAQSSGGGTGVPSGTLNITGGTCLASTILVGAGSGAVNLNSATLAVTNQAGTPSARISTFTTANSTIHLNLKGSAITTNVAVSSLTASGVTTIAIDSIANVTSTTTFPLISYGSFSGSIANFTLGSVPANFAGILTNNSGANQIDLIVTHAPATPVITSIILANTNLVMAGTAGAPTWTYYLLASTNISSPLSNWSAVQTGAFDAFGNFQITNGEDPTIPQNFFILQLP